MGGAVGGACRGRCPLLLSVTPTHRDGCRLGPGAVSDPELLPGELDVGGAACQVATSAPPLLLRLLLTGACASRPGQTSVSRTLPDSLTTWDIQAVGVFQNGDWQPWVEGGVACERA